MHCKQCGAEINDGAKFCGVCGTPTVAAAASTAGDAIYVEARPIESQSVEAQFQAAEDAEDASCLQDSLRESIGSLARASVISLLNVLFFNYVLGGGSLGLDYMIPLALLLIGPWKVIISLYRSGVRLPFVYGGGIIGITIMLIELVVLVGLPVVVLMLFYWLGSVIHGAVPVVPELAPMTMVALWPIVSVANIIFKAIKLHMARA